MSRLREEQINTWFDLGLFIDRVRDERKIPPEPGRGSFETFKSKLVKGGIAFISFHYAVDGVTVEVQKYSKAFRNILPDVPIHYIAGEILPEADRFIDSSFHKHIIKEINGFDKWKPYEDFFFTKLERGSKEYNDLIVDFWKDMLDITEKLGNYIEENKIALLYLVNVCSNPGNVSLSLATVLLSEHLGIPVINNNHDFYWDGGNKKTDIQTKGLKPGPRDFFFTNSHLGEFFSPIEVLYPYESRSWMTVNINNNQSNHVIEINGHNPANVCEVGTAVDTERYTTLTKRKKINAFLQVQAMLSNYKKKLPVYAVDEIIKKRTIDKASPDPILIGANSSLSFDFVGDNIVFLQPTRLMPRKRIEIGFKMINRLFENEEFVAKFKSNPQLTATFLITGPIPLGQYSYFLKLLQSFSELLKELKPAFRKRVFLGFLFSEFDKKRFKNRFKDPVDIPELYNIASLIMLPSETEGRGLPIIEATACGIPIFCRRYYPENVYSEVIGEHLEESDRLKVLEFDGIHITDKLIEKIINRVFFPQNYIDEVEHNKRAVQKRYSLDALQTNLTQILHKLYLQLQPNKKSYELTVRSLNQYKKTLSHKNTEGLINTKNREYLPGFGRLAFMSFLKSLIDPSFFRVEEQQTRAMAMRFARKLVRENPESENAEIEVLHHFYNCVDNIFHYYNGEIKIRHDHSFAYRHRNRKYYPYGSFTFQELTGLINMLYNKIASPPGNTIFKISPHFFTDWNLALFQLTNSRDLPIDNRKRLVKMLKANVPIAYFPGEYIKYELEFFVLQPVRARLKLKIEEELTEQYLKKHFKTLAPVYIFCQEKPLGKWFTADALKNYIANTDDNELRLLYKYGICKVVKTKQWCVGVHFLQLGKNALDILKKIKRQKGFIIANGDNAPIMTDIIDINRFHIGKAEREITSKIMGISIGSGFIQFVPAGIRTTLAYPTPIQTAKDFNDAIKSRLFKKLSKKLGEEKIFDLLKKDAEEKGTPIKIFLDNLESELVNEKKDQGVTYSYVSGVYNDNMPWSGVIANVDISVKGGSRHKSGKKSAEKWNFAAYTSKEKTKPVTDFVKQFDSSNRRKSRIAWNGGYILNPELVGKLGLPESYIGSPLGLLIMNGKVICPPLFNKPAFIVYSDGRLDIERVNSRNGIIISDGKQTIEFHRDNYNKHSNLKPCYYDLMYDDDTITGDGNIIVRIAGNTIKEVIHTRKNQNIKVIPVGMTLSIPKDQFPEEWDCVDKKLQIIMKSNKNDKINWGKIESAIEAGPLLLNGGKESINMEIEGWKTNNSINTQAARLDFTDMRGPKIAVGLDRSGNLSVLMINGRIRESVGATHNDMAEIMRNFGAHRAMGFDPGGSSTLVVDGKTLNISPYNHQYEKNIYSLPPEPRAVANAIIGWQE
ncbi:phosphodiester glycosidase family protein [bacterium AH-315-M05]|nr:phosphodiester glycosidase family protein [bacterium AH-315-M05]